MSSINIARVFGAKAEVDAGVSRGAKYSRGKELTPLMGRERLLCNQLILF